MNEHTKGPWAINANDIAGRRVFMPNDTVEIVADRSMVACLYRTNWPHGQDEANARLIAAAPDLLAALESACESFAQIHKLNRLPAGENNKGWRDARAAIAKAKSHATPQ